MFFQDLFPTYMQQSKGFSAHDATVATIIGNCVSVLFYNLSPTFGPCLTFLFSQGAISYVLIDLRHYNITNNRIGVVSLQDG